VVETAIAVLGPVAAQVLGDMGAEVIKVETPEGDPMRQIGPARNPGMVTRQLFRWLLQHEVVGTCSAPLMPSGVNAAGVFSSKLSGVT